MKQYKAFYRMASLGTFILPSTLTYYLVVVARWYRFNTTPLSIDWHICTPLLLLVATTLFIWTAVSLHQKNNVQQIRPDGLRHKKDHRWNNS